VTMTRKRPSKAKDDAVNQGAYYTLRTIHYHAHYVAACARMVAG